MRNVTAEAGLGGLRGYSLGIIAADFDLSGTLDLFITNDEVENFFLVNRSPANTVPQYDESGLISGLAFNRDGVAQACMGVALGDADGDGRFDLFVTNYYEDANTLYQQQPNQMFLDETRRANLYDASFKMLGFGTQFLDADLDGHPDLVITNGHVEDYSDEGTAFHMRPQFFRNLGDGRFQELSRSVNGRFFHGTYRGRGLARLDWNRDGREDFVVSHIGSPAALVTNLSVDVGNFVAIRLVGIVGSRDAIGTTVDCEVDGAMPVRQLVAGDGYQASNQRQLVFGLGNSDQVRRLRVRWPSGASKCSKTYSVIANGSLWKDVPQSWRFLGSRYRLCLIVRLDDPFQDGGWPCEDG